MNKLYRNKKWLINQYINLKKSTREIAKEIHSDKTQILYWLKKFEIERRKPTRAFFYCLGCGKKVLCSEFFAKRRKYCSHKCYTNHRKYKRGRTNPSYKSSVKFMCPICKQIKWFKPAIARNRKYCSLECSYQAHKGRGNPNYKDKIHKTCLFCGKHFLVWPSHKKTKYCSKMCTRKGQEGTRIAWNKGNRKGKYLICKICGKEYYANPARIKEKSKYCSWECFSKAKKQVIGVKHPLYSQVEIACDNCGKTYKEKPAKIKMYNKHFCSRRCVGIYMKAHQPNPSSIEIKLEKYLKKNRIPYQPQFKYDLGVADFIIPPNIIVECDGEYWHRLEKEVKKDKKQTAFLTANGFKVLRFWENEINNNPQNCIDKIQQYLN